MSTISTQLNASPEHPEEKNAKVETPVSDLQPSRPKHYQRERKTLTGAIANLINALNEHQKKSLRNEILLSVSTLLLFIVTGMLVYYTKTDGDARLGATRITQTLQLKKEFDSWFNDSEKMKADSSFVELQSWLYGNGTWNDLDSAKRAEKFFNNEYLIKMLDVFETAKMLDKKDLLDRDFFDNWFQPLVTRLPELKPSINDFITNFRIRSKDPKMWDGFYYCYDKLVTK